VATSKTTTKASSKSGSKATGKSSSSSPTSKSSTPSAKSGTKSTAKSGTAKSRVSQPKSAMERFKTEVASELGVNLKSENLTAKQAGQIGGEMVRRMIKKQSDQMKMK
jgi:hypothetical protein